MKYIKKFKIHPNIYQWHILYRWIFLCTIFIHPQNRRIISQKSRHACLVTRICVLAWRNRLTLWWGKAGTSESLWSTTTTSATQSTSSIIPDINLVIVLSIMDFSFAMQVLEIFIIDVYRKVTHLWFNTENKLYSFNRTELYQFRRPNFWQGRWSDKLVKVSSIKTI